MAQGTQHLTGIAEHLVCGKRAFFLHIAFKGYAVNALHNDVFEASLDRNIENPYDVRVRKHRNRFRFVDEPPDRLLVSCDFILKHFDRDRAVHDNVPGFIDDSHPADADDPDYMITSVKYLADVSFK